VRQTTKAAPAAKIRRCPAATKSPRFQLIIGPNGTMKRSGAQSGTKVVLKKGGPTVIFGPPTASSSKG
jgi:hypothetical protein